MAAAPGNRMEDAAPAHRSREPLVEVGVPEIAASGQTLAAVQTASISFAMTGELPWVASKETGGWWTMRMIAGSSA